MLSFGHCELEWDSLLGANLSKISQKNKIVTGNRLTVKTLYTVCGGLSNFATFSKVGEAI
jgi:hypothetical protein